MLLHPLPTPGRLLILLLFLPVAGMAAEGAAGPDSLLAVHALHGGLGL